MTKNQKHKRTAESIVLRCIIILGIITASVSLLIAMFMMSLVKLLDQTKIQVNTTRNLKTTNRFRNRLSKKLCDAVYYSNKNQLLLLFSGR